MQMMTIKGVYIVRDIKFRVWRFGSFVHIGNNYDLEYWCSSGADGPQKSLSEMNWEQFTGLTDDNGVGIYEGDVCRYKNGDEFSVAVIELNCFCWSLVTCLGRHDLFAHSIDIEIVGNIHQNPELLETK